MVVKTIRVRKANGVRRVIRNRNPNIKIRRKRFIKPISVVPEPKSKSTPALNPAPKPKRIRKRPYIRRNNRAYRANTAFVKEQEKRENDIALLKAKTIKEKKEAFEKRKKHAQKIFNSFDTIKQQKQQRKQAKQAKQAKQEAKDNPIGDSGSSKGGGRFIVPKTTYDKYAPAFRSSAGSGRLTEILRQEKEKDEKREKDRKDKIEADKQTKIEADKKAQAIQTKTDQRRKDVIEKIRKANVEDKEKTDREKKVKLRFKKQPPSTALVLHTQTIPQGRQGAEQGAEQGEKHSRRGRIKAPKPKNIEDIPASRVELLREAKSIFSNVDKIRHALNAIERLNVDFSREYDEAKTNLKPAGKEEFEDLMNDVATDELGGNFYTDYYSGFDAYDLLIDFVDDFSKWLNRIDLSRLERADDKLKILEIYSKSMPDNQVDNTNVKRFKINPNVQNLQSVIDDIYNIERMISSMIPQIRKAYTKAQSVKEPAPKEESKKKSKAKSKAKGKEPIDEDEGKTQRQKELSDILKRVKEREAKAKEEKKKSDDREKERQKSRGTSQKHLEKANLEKDKFKTRQKKRDEAFKSLGLDRCKGKTAKGTPCKRRATDGDYCYQHKK